MEEDEEGTGEREGETCACRCSCGCCSTAAPTPTTRPVAPAPVLVLAVATPTFSFSSFAFSSSAANRAANNAFASSSRSSNVSCLTALMEYAHTPTTNEPIARPVIVFLVRKGARARWRPGERPCVCVSVRTGGDVLYCVILCYIVLLCMFFDY